MENENKLLSEEDLLKHLKLIMMKQSQRSVMKINSKD